MAEYDCFPKLQAPYNLLKTISPVFKGEFYFLVTFSISLCHYPISLYPLLYKLTPQEKFVCTFTSSCENGNLKLFTSPLPHTAFVCRTLAGKYFSSELKRKIYFLAYD